MTANYIYMWRHKFVGLNRVTHESQELGTPINSEDSSVQVPAIYTCHIDAFGDTI